MSKIKPAFTKALPYFLAFFIPVFIFLGTLVVMPLFGISRSILFQDPNNQYIDFLNYYKTFFQDPSRLFYSFSAGIGSNMVPLVAYYLLSPFNLLVLLFPNELVGYAYLLIVLLKIGFLGLTSYIFFRKNNNQEKTHYKEIIFSLAYSLSAFVICYFFHFEWLDALILLPLVCLGINKIITDQKPWLYITTLILSIITNYYIGFMLCIFSVLWFLYQYLLRAKLCQLKSHLKEFWQFIWASLLSGGISAIVVIPTIYSVFSQTGDRAQENVFDIATQFPIFDIFGQLTSNFIYGMPYLFAGTIITILVVCYFLNQSIGMRERVLSGAILLVFLVSFNTPLFNAFWHGLSMTHGAPYRYSFIATFFLIYLAYKGFNKIKAIHQKRVIAVLAIYIIIYILAFRRILDFREHILLAVDFIIAFTACLLIYKNNTTAKKINLSKVFLSLQCANIIILMLFNWTFLETVEGGVTSFSSSKEAITEISPAVEALKKYDKDFYRIEKTFNRTENDGLQFDYFGTSLYSSSTPSKLKKTFSEFGMDSGKHYATNIFIGRNYEPIYGDLNTCTATSILGIKYIISHKDISSKCQYKEVLQSGDMKIYENKYNLSIGLAANKNSLDNNTAQNYSQDPNSKKNTPDYLNEFAELISQNNSQPIKKISRERYSIEYHNLNVNDGIYTKTNSESKSYIIYHIQNQSKDNIYFDLSYLKNQNPSLAGLNILDISRIYKVKPDKTKEVTGIIGSLLNLGNDTEITLKVEILVDKIVLNQENLFTENISEVEKMYKGAIEQKVNLYMKSQTHLFGDVDIKKENQVLLFTIPYDDGWNVYVDGEKIDTSLVLGDFMATTTNISPGKHNIELKFIPQGFIYGVIISSVSIVLTGTTFIISRRKNNG